MARLTGVLCGFGLLFPLTAAAGDIAVGGKLSSVGLGIEFDKFFDNRNALRAGVNDGGGERRRWISGIDTKTTEDYLSLGAIYDWAIWKATQDSIHLSAGLYGVDRKIKGESRSTNITIGNTDYPNATLSWEMRFDHGMPFLGGGWTRTMLKDHLLISADLGVLYVGNPKMQISSSAASESDLATEAEQIKDYYRDRHTFPYAGYLGVLVGYKF